LTNKQVDTLTAPVRCASMIEVRREIDRVDRAIVALLAERLDYIAQAGNIKGRRAEVRDEARIKDVLAKVTAEASNAGADPDLVAKLYRDLIEWCITYEFTVFDRRQSLAAVGHCKEALR